MCDKNLLLVEGRGKGLNELEVAQVFKNRAAPLGQRGRQVPASMLELRGGRGLHSGVLLGDETAEVVLVVADATVGTRAACWPAAARSMPALLISRRRLEM